MDAWRKLVRLLRAFVGVILILLALVGGLLDVPGVAERYPSIGRYLLLPSERTLFLGFVIAIGAYVIWTDFLGPYRSDRLARAMPIFEIEMSLSRLHQTAPWIEFYVFGFNGTGAVFAPVGVRGRLRIGGEEFHEQLDLLRIGTGNDPTEPQGYFQINMRAPLSAAAVVRLQEKKISVSFAYASIQAYVGEWPLGRTFDIPIPADVVLGSEKRVNFARRLSQENA